MHNCLRGMDAPGGQRMISLDLKLFKGRSSDLRRSHYVSVSVYVRIKTIPGTFLSYYAQPSTTVKFVSMMQSWASGGVEGGNCINIKWLRNHKNDHVKYIKILTHSAVLFLFSAPSLIPVPSKCAPLKY